ncbi:MAG: prepilin-type N-terminal cleavage/methylation domain-containing protein [Planctomycetota bacterium]
MKYRDQKKLFRGFTLIELLVVISIIALLIGILLPALSMTRTSALAVKCLSNQRQIGVGIYAYAADNDGAIPRGSSSVGFDGLTPPLVHAENTANNYLWFAGSYMSHGTLVNGYISELEVMDCPDGPSPKLTPGTLEDVGDTSVFAVAVAYTYRNLDETTNDKIEDLGFNQAGERASMLLWDVAMDVPPVNVFGIPEQLNLNHKSTVTNALYIDGHAESTPYEPDFVLFRKSDYAALPLMTKRTDNILIRFDHAQRGGSLSNAPQLP